jgi:hypothetical protein
MMFRTVMGWEIARLKARLARDGTLWVIAIGPAVLVLPLSTGGLFETWTQAAMVIGWIYGLLVAGRLGGDAGLLHESALWLFQRGHSMVDYSIARFLTATALAFMCASYAAIWYLIGAFVQGQYSATQHAAWSISLLLVVTVSLAVLYLVGALGSRRSADFLIVIAILSLAQDAILSRISQVLAHAVHILLPPYPAIFQFTRNAFSGAAADAMLGAFHIVAFATVCLAGASVFHARWRPRLASSA